MRAFLARRLIATVATGLAVSVLVFLLIRLAPGDAVTMWIGQEGTMTPEVRDTLRKMFGLSDPVAVQYLHWLGDAARGDLGYSFRSRLPVVALLGTALPVTLELAALAMLLAIVTALPLGVFSAVKHGTPADATARLLGLLGFSMPSFWLAVLMILASATYFKWLPALIYVGLAKNPIENLKQMLMPAVSLGLPLMAVLMRMTRSTMLDVLGQDYVRTARAKGAGESAVLARHALKNALIPVVTVMGIQLGRLLGGAVIIEQIFGVPGVGTALVAAITQRDYPMVQATVLALGLLFIAVQFFVDISYAAIDPRVRYG
ncbi:MAG TPA: ABC transporter permease [bacterium]|nr:ABC transporter permease [bacterium]